MIHNHTAKACIIAAEVHSGLYPDLVSPALPKQGMCHKEADSRLNLRHDLSCGGWALTRVAAMTEDRLFTPWARGPNLFRNIISVPSKSCYSMHVRVVERADL
jgi:hypothetical protein